MHEEDMGRHREVSFSSPQLMVTLLIVTASVVHDLCPLLALPSMLKLYVLALGLEFLRSLHAHCSLLPHPTCPHTSACNLTKPFSALLALHTCTQITSNSIQATHRFPFNQRIDFSQMCLTLGIHIQFYTNHSSACNLTNP